MRQEYESFNANLAEARLSVLLTAILGKKISLAELLPKNHIHKSVLNLKNQAARLEMTNNYRAYSVMVLQNNRFRSSQPFRGELRRNRPIDLKSVAYVLHRIEKWEIYERPFQA